MNTPINSQIKEILTFDRSIDSIIETINLDTPSGVYFVTSKSKIYTSVEDSWVSLVLPKWFEVVIKETGQVYIFDGVSLVQKDYPCISQPVQNDFSFYQPDSTGLVDCSSLLLQYIGDSSKIVLPEGVYKLSQKVVIPRDIEVVVQKGCNLIVEDSLTIMGEFTAPLGKVFAGGGIVLGIRKCHPEWWGAETNNSLVDSQPALQKALNCIAFSSSSKGPRQSLPLGAGEYLIDRCLTVTPKSNVNLHMYGQGSVFGTRITASNNFSGDTAIFISGSLNEMDAAADFVIENFSVSANPSKNVYCGVSIGGSVVGLKLSGLQQSVIRGVCVENFSYCWKVSQARLIRFEHCSAWPNKQIISGAVGLEITLNSQGFTGDLVFDNCQFVATSTTTGVNIYIHHSIPVNTGGVGQIKGLKFLSCTLYGGLISVLTSVSSGGAIGDIWFESCQQDGIQVNGFELSANGDNSVIDDFHITDHYIRGYTGTAFRTSTTGTGKIATFKINGGWSANGGRVADLKGNLSDVNIFNHSMMDIAFAGPAIETGPNVRDSDISHNRLTHTGDQACTNLVRLAPGGSGIICMANRSAVGTVTGGAVLDELGSVVPKYVAGNI